MKRAVSATGAVMLAAAGVVAAVSLTGGSSTAAIAIPPPITNPLAVTGNVINVPVGGSWNNCYQAANPGDTCKLAAGTYSAQTLAWRAGLPSCNRDDPSTLIKFDASAGVTVNGDVELDGSCAAVIGVGASLNINGEIDTFGIDPKIPTDDLFMNLHAVHFGALGADRTRFDGVNIGPATVKDYSGGAGTSCAAIEGSGDENKIVGRWVTGGSNHTPKDIVLINSFIHNQQGYDNGPNSRGNCHYGGLFIVNVDGFLAYNTVFQQNVVYHVQIQNFSGPAPTGINFINNSFSCPITWLDNGVLCDGQRAIQLNTTSTGITGVIQGNNSADGTGGIFGCYVGDCSNSGGITVSNNNETPPNVIAPPLPNGGGTTTTTSTSTSTSTQTSTSTTTSTSTSTSTQTSTTTSPPPDSLPLRIISQTTSKITIGWTPAGNRGYIFYVNGTRVSNTFDASRSSVTFSKKSGATYKVESIKLNTFGSLTP